MRWQRHLAYIANGLPHGRLVSVCLGLSRLLFLISHCCILLLSVILLHSFCYLTVWGVEPVVTHHTSWLESTGVCGVQQDQAGGSSVRKKASCLHMSAQSGYHDGELLPCQRVNTTSIYMVHLPTDAMEHAGLASQFVACHKACCMQGTQKLTGDGDSFVPTQIEGVVRGHISTPGVG